jgi:hypothetical protein
MVATNARVIVGGCVRRRADGDAVFKQGVSQNGAGGMPSDMDGQVARPSERERVSQTPYSMFATNSRASNGAKSLSCSPVPTKRVGIPNSS